MVVVAVSESEGLSPMGMVGNKAALIGWSEDSDMLTAF